MILAGQAIARRVVKVAWLLLVCIAVPAVAADQAVSHFRIKVTLASSDNDPLANADRAFCTSHKRPDDFGAKVTVLCSTGEVVEISTIDGGSAWRAMHGGAFRFVNIPAPAGLIGQIEGFASISSILSWRQARFSDRDYFELLIGW